MPADVHRRFLQLLGWDGEELEAFLPEWLKTTEFLHLTEADVAFAVEEWLPTYWDMSMNGTRKFIAAVIREAAAMAHAGDYMASGDSVIYSMMPSAAVCVYANRLAGGGKVHIFYPYFIIATVWTAFFGRELDARLNGSGLDPACQHCAMNCLRADSTIKGMVTPPTVIWNWGLQCDEAPKTDEMLKRLEKAGWKSVLTTLPHDAPLGMDESGDDERVSYLAQEMRVAQRQVTEYTGVEVTDAYMSAAMDEYLGYLRRVERLTDLVMNSDPVPMYGNDLTLFSLCMECAFDTGYGYINDALDTAIAEVEQRISEGRGVLPKGSPKLACHFSPLNVPWIDKVFRDNGVNLTLGRMFPPASKLINCVRPGDAYRSAASMCLEGPNNVNMLDEVRMTCDQLNKYPVDGALYGFFAFDRWIGALEKIMIREAEERTGIPHFYLEGDFWNGARFSLDDKLATIRGICNCLKISGLTAGK